MEFVMLVAMFILGWLLGGIHVYNQEIKILNGFRKRVEDIEAKYYADLEKHEEITEGSDLM